MPRPTLQLLLHDDRVVAVDKPAGLAVVPGRAEQTCLIQQLAQQLHIPHTGPADPRLRLVHRIDKDTTGVLLMALDRDTQRFLSHQFQNNTIEKQYLALVAGTPLDDEGLIDAPLAPHPTVRERMTVARKGGKRAISHWRVEQRFKLCTLVRVFPRTGKTHQIRVHLAHIGHPLLIDPLYNPGTAASQSPGLMLSSFKRGYRPARDHDERPLIARLTLHAASLTFTHPTRGPLTIESPPPKDLAATLRALTKFASA